MIGWWSIPTPPRVVFCAGPPTCGRYAEEPTAIRGDWAATWRCPKCEAAIAVMRAKWDALQARDEAYRRNLKRAA
jgi:hypothetical protein